jgi:hypothetical protein
LDKARRFLLFIVLATALVMYRAPSLLAESPASGVAMGAQPAFGGYFKYGEWLLVWVELENTGPDLEAQIQVHLTGGGTASVFAAPASMPTGSRKRIPLYLLPNNFSHELEVQLLDGTKLLASQRVTVNPWPNNTYFVGLAAPQRGALSVLPGARLGMNGSNARPKEIVDFSLADLPQRPEGLRSFDCLILNDLDTTSLSPEQKAALQAWVNDGGRLIIGGGAGAARTAAGLPPSLVPLMPNTVTELDELPALSGLGGDQPIRISGPFVVATGEMGEGRILAAQGSLPLVVEQVVGSGYVDFVALDLAVSPFDAWAGTLAFWERLISPGSAYPQWLPPDVSQRQLKSGPMSYALSNLPSLDLPSVQGLALLLAVYILLVGPANYLILRWRKRLQWAWVTMPLLTIAFSAGAFGLAYGLHGTDVILNRIALIALQSDGRTSVTSYVGLFSPSQQSYEIEVADGGLVSPLTPDYDPWGSGGLNAVNETVFVEGDPARVTGLSVNQWSMQTFTVEGVRADLGRITTDLHLEGQSLVGTVRNETPYALSDVVLILGNNFARLGDLSSGQEGRVTMTLPGPTNVAFGPPFNYRLFEKEMSQPGPNGPPREAQLKQSVLNALFEPQGWPSKLGQQLGLIGWLREAPSEIRVNGRTPVENTTALVYMPLSYSLPETGTISLPPGLIGGVLIEMPAEGGTCGSPGTTAIYVGRGQAVVEFQLPAQLHDMHVDELALALAANDGQSQLPALALYDWETAGWVAFENVAVGTYTIPASQNLVSPEGLVHVRLSSDGGSGSCVSVDLGFNGTR